MSAFRRFVARVINTIRPGVAERELSREMDAHLSLLEEELRRGGAPADQARRDARRAFGGVDQIREQHRDARSFRWLSDALRDVRLAVRAHRRRPGFAVAAVATIALGIGSTAAVFAVFDAVLLKPLPVRDAGRLVLFSDITGEGTQTGTPPVGQWPIFSTAIFEFLRGAPLPFESLAAVRSGETVVALRTGLDGTPQRAQVHLVSGNYFDTLGASPARGRPLRLDDDRRGAAPVAVISDRFWTTAFARDHTVLGRVITVNRLAVTVVGVAQPEFFGERMRRSPDLWIPLAFQPEVELQPALADRGDAYWLNLIGRLRDGTTVSQAEAAATIALRQFLLGPTSPLREGDRKDVPRARLALVDGSHGVSLVRENSATSLAVLLAAVAAVLLIATANIAGILISRAAARRGEFGLRAAIGASRWRLFRQCLAENAVLTIAGASAGLLLARWLMDLLLTSFAGSGYPVRAALEPRVLFVAAVATVLVTLLFGIAPVFALRADGMSGALKPSPSIHGSGRFGLHTFIVVQLAACVLLLVAANLFARTLINLERQPLGFDADRVLLARLSPRLAGHTPATAIDLYRRLLERVDALPGVDRATLARYSPLSGSSSHHSGAVEGYVPADDEPVQLEEVPVGPDYPQALGIAIVEGRAITPDDTLGRAKVGMVNEAFVRRYFAAQSPIGRHFGVSGTQGRSGPTDIEIVGVLDDARFHDARETIEPMVFTALWQNTTQTALDAELEIRMAGPAPLSAATLRETIREVDPNLTIGEPRALAAQVSSQLNGPRVTGRLIEAFSAVALLLAAVGIYGVVAQSVVRRSNEIGVRLALGTPAPRIRLLFVKEFGALLAVALPVGIAASLVVGRIVASQLYGLPPNDPWSLTTAIAVLVVVTFVAGLVPAERATRLDPLRVLRQS